MQFAPPEDSPNALGTIAHDSSSNPQHGLQSVTGEPSDSFDDNRLVREVSGSTEPSDDASVASSATSRGRQAIVGRMNARNDSEESSPGSRIDAYEKAYATHRRPSDEMVFQVVPSSGPATGVSLPDMPNGKNQNYPLQLS